MNFSHWDAIRTVAGREIRTALRTKSLIITMIVILVLMLGAAIAASVFMHPDEDTPQEKPQLAVTASIDPAALDQAAGDAFEVNEVPDREAAAAAVEKGEARAALVTADPAHVELISQGGPGDSITVAESYVRQAALNRALADHGIDPAGFGTTMRPAELTVTDIDQDSQEDSAGDSAQFASQITTAGGIFIIFFIVLLFAGTIGGRVTEEKSSRIVEIILATIRPIDLLTGKLLGNLVVGTLATALIILVGVGAAFVTGLAGAVPINYGILPLLLLAFVLAMLFYGSLYAAAGSMVARTEDLQSTSMPIMLFVFASMYAPVFGAAYLDSPVMEALGWIPPMSITVAPVHYGAGNWGLATTLASMALGALATGGAIALVARIYRNSILRNGKKVSWRAAIKG